MGRSRKKQPDGKVTPGDSEQSVKIRNADKRPEEKSEKKLEKKPLEKSAGKGEEKADKKAEEKKPRSRKAPSSVPDNELRRYILLLSVPMTALLLVIVVLISGKVRKVEQEVLTTSARHSVETVPENASIPVIEPDTKEYFHDFGGSILSQDTVPEMNQLMEQYFLSISECDMATFLHLFTSEDTSEEERYRQEFERQKQYIEGYQNISCYTTPGPEEDSYAAYVYYEIKYVGVETPAPSLVEIYAVKGEDGIYRIYDQQKTPEQEAFFSQLAVNEDVRLLVSQVDQQMEEAMAADPALNERILFMKQGPDYMREETEADTPQADAQETEEN